jgi:BASS family bile acid:Na+ symporter
VDLASLIQLALTASLLLLVFALGLRATVADATHVLRRPALILRAFLAMGVIVPVAAAVLAAVFALAPAVEIARVQQQLATVEAKIHEAFERWTELESLVSGGEA